MAKKTELYTVRNSAGQLMGRWRAKTSAEAVNYFLDSQRAIASTFRKSQPYNMHKDTFTAKVEG